MKASKAKFVESARMLKAMAHPARLRLLERLAEGECCVSEVENCLGLSQPNVSQHLTVLKRAKVIAGSRDRTRICYRISDERIRRILQLVLKGDS
jgi:DNA-binding transcriptional ArsR family regulator